ncbi:alpha/beta hydrolase [Bradyrhizobium sp. U87765 SZCCT0131]|uniref:alpha/beta fold hydrolase n=1 Tax=unclassified Bradyrhizobium TaxID=2631580 RepID=UPI001BAAB5E5|nr:MULTISPECIES: alpha/beta hydrolase [unclassified Bradyrhizobium]MBR1221295.1 alpha/beta hydrolase [Bradyrhizobium sp. U87765 SZCCT0131]MBR1264782.1 alpha/beta hydrolase [Bradyrhizobium sp. U87765 SZCCT0134]MBR1304312.1 alpha/beta hydrolase [Bradyrhizobium sp. U87765 SZCCT0110]MBR1322831.1 alpha/beta hydrolase [Bradyrhizobium sp. U87765 SZCCT0109]MBR1346241.1 alpha/beta hydrolase [Bradyrhizobium sp. U87765 SZCCT0048]
MHDLQPASSRPRLAWQSDGKSSDVPVLLIHGLGQTLHDWPVAFVDGLTGAGCRVIRFDNRDVGRSPRFDHLGAPPLLRLWLCSTLRLPQWVRPPYSVAEMAADAVALLDALDIPAAHLVGASMGGMIAQHIALAHPRRVQSLTLIMSSSGAPGLPSPRSDVQKALSGGEPASLPAAIAAATAFRRLIAGPLAADDLAELEQRVARSTAYGWPGGAGVARQYAAILADRARWRQLARIAVRCLVVHGERDPLLPLAHGQDAAGRIPGSRFLPLAAMGHEITPSHASAMVPEILRLLRET